MKKFICGVITGTMLAGTIALAASYTAEPAAFKVMVNGKEFTSAPAMVINGSTYLPLRAMGDVLGVPVNWNEELRQAEVGTVASNNDTEPAKISDNVLSNDKWKMTYLNYKTMPQVDEYQKAADGKEFLLVFFEIENISSETQNYSLFNLDYYIDDVKTPQTLLTTRVDDASQLTATSVEPGKKAKGYFAFEVSPDWKKAEITYNEDLTKKDTTNALKFTLNK